MNMGNYRAQFIAHKIPEDNSKCLVSFSATWLSSDSAKGQEKMENIFKMWQMLFEKLIPEKI